MEEMGSEFNNLPEAIDLVMAQKLSELWSLLVSKATLFFLICNSENGKMNELGRKVVVEKKRKTWLGKRDFLCRYLTKKIKQFFNFVLREWLEIIQNPKAYLLQLDKYVCMSVCQK